MEQIKRICSLEMEAVSIVLCKQLSLYTRLAKALTSLFLTIKSLPCNDTLWCDRLAILVLCALMPAFQESTLLTETILSFSDVLAEQAGFN